jgi:mono/diheme cytochrome c family protein
MRRWFAGFLVLLVTAGCHPLDDVLVLVFGRSMREQPSLKPYDAPQAPPEGSVPFAAGNFPAGPGQVGLGQAEGTPIPPPVAPIQLLLAIDDPEAVPEVTGLENPVAPEQASLARGEEVYARVCVPCHGAAGDGTGPVTAIWPPFGIPLVEGPALALSDSYIYSIIRAGRGAMPAFGHQVSHYDRWHVANYVLQLQGRLGQDDDAPDTEPSGN